MVKKRRGMSKKGLELEMIGWWILGLAVLVLVILGISVLTGKGTEAINYIKKIFGFG
jgi:hypothetical protein